MIWTLEGVSNHGKNRIREHGNRWEVLSLPPGVCRIDPKPVDPAIKSLKTGEWRWFRSEDVSIVDASSS